MGVRAEWHLLQRNRYIKTPLSSFRHMPESRERSPQQWQLDPGMRRDDGSFSVSKCHSRQSTFISNINAIPCLFCCRVRRYTPGPEQVIFISHDEFPFTQPLKITLLCLIGAVCIQRHIPGRLA